MNTSEIVRNMTFEIYDQIEADLENIMAAGVPASQIILDPPKMVWNDETMSAKLVASISFKP